jgi:hypothetical protein
VDDNPSSSSSSSSIMSTPSSPNGNCSIISSSNAHSGANISSGQKTKPVERIGGSAVRTIIIDGPATKTEVGRAQREAVSDLEATGNLKIDDNGYDTDATNYSLPRSYLEQLEKS